MDGYCCWIHEDGYITGSQAWSCICYGRNLEIQLSQQVDVSSFCKVQCTADPMCKGYSYRKDKEFCSFTTKSTCPEKCFEYGPQRTPGDVLDYETTWIYECKSRWDAGCFIKQKGKYLH